MSIPTETPVAIGSGLPLALDRLRVAAGIIRPDTSRPGRCWTLRNNDLALLVKLAKAEALAGIDLAAKQGAPETDEALRTVSKWLNEDCGPTPRHEIACLCAALQRQRPIDDPLRALLAAHSEMLVRGPYAHDCYFELAYARYSGWMAWICSNEREDGVDRTVLAQGHGPTLDDACRAALASMSPGATRRVTPV